MSAFLNLFEQRVRGIRLIELIGLALALGMIFWVCLSKAREGEDIRRASQLDQQITEESQAVSALKIKVAQLERPARLEALATTYLGMKPVESTHEAHIDSLSEISRTTSRPVPIAAGQTVVVAPVAAPVVDSGDDLISTGSARPSAPRSSGTTASAPATTSVNMTISTQKAGAGQ